MKFRILTRSLFSLFTFGACLAEAVTLPFHDSFSYVEGRLNDVGAPTWFAGSSGTELSVTNPAALSAPEGYPAASGAGVRRTPSGTARRSVIQYTSLPATEGNSMYVSFLLDVQSAPSSGQLLGYLDNNSTSQGSPQAGIFIDGNARVGIGKKSSAAGFTHGAALAAGPHLIVARYTFQSGNDRVDLWVDPPASSYGLLTEPASLGSVTGATDPSSLDYFQLYSTPSAGGVQFIDELRLGTSWAEVVPSSGPLVGQKLGFTTQPTDAAPAEIMIAVVVQVQTAGGAAVASNGVPITLSLSSGTGTLSGTLMQNTDSTGKATFSDLSIDTAGSGKRLTAVASGIGQGLLSATSTVFSIVAVPVGTKLAFTTQPMDGVVNTTLNGVIVQIQDENSLPVASNNVPITLTLTSGTGTLLGTTTRNTDGTGKAIFNDLSIDTVGADKQFTATASGIGTGLTDAVSDPFNITLTPVGTKLAFTVQPSSTAAFAVMSDVVVQILANNDAPVASNDVPITLTLTLGSGTLMGTTTQYTDPTGKATLSGLSIDTSGAAKQLTAAATGIGAGLTPAFSAIFAITAPTMEGGPVITQAVRTVSGMILRGTNGAPGGEFQVLSATNVAQSAPDWTPVQTNAFAGNGSFDCTNGVLPDSAVEFFQLLSLTGRGGLPDFDHHGFAGVDSSGNPYALTGGSTNLALLPQNVVTVSNYTQLGDAISNSAPLIIQVVGEIYMRTNGNFYMKANKTLVGLGTNATLVGCLGLYGNAPGGAALACSNIIIRNINLRNPNQFGEDDGIAIKYGAHHIWIDHCTFRDVYDGTVDITRESDFVTVSWCRFFYTSVNSHGDTVSLIGGDDGDDSDLGKLHVTLHHNWWGPLCRERMPSVRFGRIHVYNNYFNSSGNHYCTRTRLYAEVLVENNYYDNVFNPWELATSSQGPNGKLRASGNITNNCTFSTSHYNPSLPSNGQLILIPGTNTLSSGINELNPPPYPYTLAPALDVPSLVTTHAGAGRGPFAP